MKGTGKEREDRKKKRKEKRQKETYSSIWIQLCL